MSGSVPPSLMAKTPEGRLTVKILNQLKARGGFWVKIHGSAFQTAGLPDIIGCYRGRFVAFEVKTPETAHNTSMAQRLMIKRIATAGGIPRIVTSAQDAMGVIDSIDRSLNN